MTRYLNFNGLASRSEYWAVILLSTALFLVNILVAGFIISLSTSNALIVISALVIFVQWVITVWMIMATAVRRCRDAGISPLWVLVLLVPYLGWIPGIVFGCIPTDKIFLEE